MELGKGHIMLTERTFELAIDKEFNFWSYQESKRMFTQRKRICKVKEDEFIMILMNFKCFEVTTHALSRGTQRRCG